MAVRPILPGLDLLYYRRLARMLDAAKLQPDGPVRTAMVEELEVKVAALKDELEAYRQTLPKKESGEYRQVMSGSFDDRIGY